MASEEELRQKIEKYRRAAAQVDPATAQRIQKLIGELEDQLKGLATPPSGEDK